MSIWGKSTQFTYEIIVSLLESRGWNVEPVKKIPRIKLRISKDGQRFGVHLRGRRRLTEETINEGVSFLQCTEKQTGETVFVVEQNCRRANLAPALGMVITQVELKRIIAVVAPFRRMLEINEWLSPDESRCQIRIRAAELAEYEKPENHLEFAILPITAENNLFERYGGFKSE
jgi:hypothetical protein